MQTKNIRALTDRDIEDIAAAQKRGEHVGFIVVGDVPLPWRRAMAPRVNTDRIVQVGLDRRHLDTVLAGLGDLLDWAYVVEVDPRIWLVADGVATPPAERIATGYAGKDWVLVRADTSDDALNIAAAYDATPETVWYAVDEPLTAADVYDGRWNIWTWVDEHGAEVLWVGSASTEQEAERMGAALGAAQIQEGSSGTVVNL